MWTKIARFILRYRVAIIITLGLMTATMGYFAKNVSISYEYARLLPREDSAFIQYKEFVEEFGADANAMIIGFRDTSFFELKKFNEFNRLCDSLREFDDVIGVASVSEAIYFKKDTSAKKFMTLKYFEKEATSQKLLDHTADTVSSLSFYKNILFNPETKVYLLVLTIKQSVLDSPAREKLIDEIVDEIDAFSNEYNIDVYYSGLPYIRTKTSLKLRQELFLFIFFAGLICAVILFLFFRSFRVVLFSMVVVGVGVVFVMGWMGIFGFEISILSALIPPLIIVIGVPNCVFLLNKYHAEYKIHGNKIKALQRVIRKIGNATFLTNLTTASGFATFIITSSIVLKEFGIIAFLGIIGVFFFSILLIPTIFSFLPPPSEKHMKHLENKWLNKIVDQLIHITVHYRKRFYMIVLGIVALGIFGMSLMTSTGYVVDDLPHHDPIMINLKFLEKNFNGALPLEISIDTKKPTMALKLKTLRKVQTLYDSLATYPEVSRPISLLDVVKFARQAYYNGNEKYYSLPNGFDKNFIFNYITKESSEIQYALIDSTHQKIRVSCNVKDVGTVRMKTLEADLLEDINGIFAGDEFEITVTGSSIIFFKGTNYLIKNLFQSLLLAIILISIFMAWMFRSWRMVIVSLIPNLLPQLLTASLMGYLGIPIKPSTILVFSIAFGISVDDTIHFLAKYRQELTHTNWNIGLSVITAIKETGLSMIYTSIILFFGFGIFVMSQFGGTVALGALVSTALLLAMLSNLLLLPSLLLTLERVISNKEFKEPLMQIFDEEEDIDLDGLRVEKKNDVEYE